MLRLLDGCAIVRPSLSKALGGHKDRCVCATARNARRCVGASTLVFVTKDSFRWVQGREFVTRYEPVPPFKYVRCFCQKCGTALGEIESQEYSFPIAANCFDDDPIVRNLFHEFVINKPAWYEICDSAKQFPEHPVKSQP